MFWASYFLKFNPRKIIFNRLKPLPVWYNKKENSVFQIRKSKSFGDFECLLFQNSTNQDSLLSWFFQTIWKTVRKSKNVGLQGIISAWEWFQNLLCKKSAKRLKNWISWLLEIYFIWSTYHTKIFDRCKLFLECY